MDPVRLAVLVVLAVLVARGPRRRSSLLVTGRRFSTSRPGRPPRGAGGAPALTHAVSTVTALLHAGLSPAQAWAEVLGRATGPDGVPDVADLLGRDPTAAGGGPGPWSVRLRELAGFAAGPDPARVHRALTVVAAARLAGTLGAPLGPVLERVGEGLAADEENDGDRRTALAAPRSTATLLGWLPLTGPLLGAVVGADPIGVVLGGGAGTLAAVTGVGLVVVGRMWVARLIRLAHVRQGSGSPA